MDPETGLNMNVHKCCFWW